MALDLEKTDFKNGFLIIQTDDGYTIIPEIGATPEQKEIIDEFKQAYPHGKEDPIIEPSDPAPTDIEVLQAKVNELETENANINYVLMMGGLI